MNLTDRQREITQLLAQGLTDREIGDQLSLSVNTIKKILQDIYGELGLEGKGSRVKLAVFAAKKGI